MVQSSVFWPMLAGLCFGIWPLLMKSSGLNPSMASLVLTTVSLLVYLTFLRTGFDQVALGRIVVLFAVVAGVLNGIGTLAFQKAVGGRELDLTTAVLIVIMLQLVITVVGGLLFYGDPLTGKRFLGFCTAVITAYLLTSK